ncbi:MAG: hypothetical protein ABIO38_08995 [Luteimonas sp.]
MKPARFAAWRNPLRAHALMTVAPWARHAYTPNWRRLLSHMLVTLV